MWLKRVICSDKYFSTKLTPWRRCQRPKRPNAKLELFNASIRVHAQVADLVPATIHQLLDDAQIILDGTDNFETRYLINDFAIQQGIPWIYSAAIGSYSATMNILPAMTACLACIFPASPRGSVETCDTAGILNTAVNLAASVQVTETLKYLVGDIGHMRRTLLAFDLWDNQRSEISAASARPDCEVCVKRNFVHLSGDSRPHITLCGRNSVQIHEHHRPLDFAILEARLKPHGVVRHNSMLLRFQRGEHTITLFPDGRALIQGTTDIPLARSLYARFIGM